jgi:hypothetical protein
MRHSWRIGLGALAALPIAAASAQAPPVFTPTSSPISLGAGHSGLVLGLADLNADGWPDAVVSTNVRQPGGGPRHRFGVVLNRGDGRFSPVIWSDVGSAERLPRAAMALADLDSDGSADLVTSRKFPPGGGVHSNLAVAFGTPTGQFVNTLDLRTTALGGTNSPSVQALALAACDTDGDGFADIVTAGVDGRLSVLRGDGRGRFAPPLVSGRAVTYDFLLAGDVDGDGAVDIVAVSDGGSPVVAETLVTVNLGNRDGTFADAGTVVVDVRTRPTIDADARAILKPMDGSGRACLVLFGEEGSDYGDGGIVVLKYEGPHRLAWLYAESREDDGYRTQTIDVADVDGDGFNDIIKIPGPAKGPGQVLVNDGHGAVAARRPFPATADRLSATASANLVAGGPQGGLHDLMVVAVPINPAQVSRTWCLGNGTPPPCPVDYDGNGVVNEADFAQFVDAWIEAARGHGLYGDVDGDGRVTTADLMEFMRLWFEALAAGC